jgi:hypothetical protein
MDPNQPSSGAPSSGGAPMWPQGQYPPPPPQLAPPPPKKPSAMGKFWNHPVVIASIMGTLVLLVTALTVIAVVALKKDDKPDNSAPNNNAAGAKTTGPASTPRTTATEDDDSGANSGSSSDPNTDASPSANTGDQGGNSDIFLNGKFEMSTSYPNTADFDHAKTSADEEDNDMKVESTQLTAQNKGKLYKLPTGAASKAACTGGAWQDSVHLSLLVDDVVVCFQTSEGRVGALTLSEVKKNENGQLSQVKFDWVLWKKAGDL